MLNLKFKSKNLNATRVNKKIYTQFVIFSRCHNNSKVKVMALFPFCSYCIPNILFLTNSLSQVKLFVVKLTNHSHRFLCNISLKSVISLKARLHILFPRAFYTFRCVFEELILVWSTNVSSSIMHRNSGNLFRICDGFGQA